ncbi:cytochrome c [Labilibacter sediminis]|nr:cytochrome c [Labilibacter sediminis]
MKKLLFILGISLAIYACSNSSDDEIKPVNGNAEYEAAETYFNNTLKPIVDAKCVSCHTGYHSKSNSSNYGTLSNAINRASGMYNQVNAGNMPKGGDKLPQEDIDKFKAFLDLVNKIP